jgi:hypothetical protein
MKRFLRLVSFFLFCAVLFGAVDPVFAGEPEIVDANIAQGVGLLAENELAIELRIRDEDLTPLYEVPFVWELFKNGVSIQKGRNSTNYEGIPFRPLSFTDLENYAQYRVDVWVEVQGVWHVASLSFQLTPGLAMPDSDVLVESEDGPPSVGGDGGGGGGGCDSIGLGLGIFVLASGVLLRKGGKKSGKDR